MTPAVFLAGGAVVAAAIAGGAYYADRKRRAALADYCLVRGYRYEAERSGAWEPLQADFALFRQGHSRRWRSTISGTSGGQPFTAFEYTWVTGGGKSSNRHRCAMVLWEADEARLPQFSLVPEGFLQRIAQRFGVKDFDFDADPEFSKAYQLQGDDEAAVRALFTPARRMYLTAPPSDGGKTRRHNLAGSGARLLWWRDGGLPGPDRLDQFIADADAVRRQFIS